MACATRRASRPGVEQRDAGRREIDDIARDNDRPVHECGGSDQGVSLGSRIRHMQACAAPSDNDIHWQNARAELGQYALIEPPAQDIGLLRILPRDPEHPEFQLQDRDHR